AVFIGCRLERTLERSCRGIVDRADQAGHIAGSGGLAPALLDTASRFAFEIYDGDVVLDDQHLPEMKITVATSAQISRSQAPVRGLKCGGSTAADLDHGTSRVRGCGTPAEEPSSAVPFLACQQAPMTRLRPDRSRVEAARHREWTIAAAGHEGTLSA